jgi:hypothetical protein
MDKLKVAHNVAISLGKNFPFAEKLPYLVTLFISGVAPKISQCVFPLKTF